MPSTFPINPSVLPTIPTRKALLIIDLQNDFLSPSGALCASEPEGFVERTLELAKAFRESNAGDVIWVRTEFEHHRPLTPDGDQVLVTDLPVRRPPARGRRPASRVHDDAALEADEEAFLSMPAGTDKTPCVLKDTIGAELAPDVRRAVVAGRDIVFTKTHYSAFASGQELIQMLRGRFVTEMYICGALTNVSIYATAIDGGQHGYDMTVIDDCCGYRNELRHMAALRQLTQLTGSEIVNAEEVMATFQPKASKKPASSAKRGETKAEGGSLEPAKSTGLSPAISKITLSQGGASAAAPSSPPAPSPQPLEADTNAPLEAQSDDGSQDSDENDSAFGRRAKRLQAARLALQASASQVDEEQSHPSPRREQARVRVQLRRRARASSPESKPEAKAGPVDNKLPVHERPGDNKSVDKKHSDKAPVNKSAEDKKSVKAAEPKKLETSHSPEMTAERSKTTLQTNKAPKMEHHTPNVSQPMCEGDTTVITDVLPADLARTAFERLLNEVSWAGMSHLGGEVPRRIAVQGEVDKDGNMPVYRHPSDESPPLLPFSPTVLAIKEEVEKHLGHPLNHVLIQHYRSGNDYISEHSDKTLDIVRGSYIANVSLGAERTMIFRTKRPPKDSKEGSPPANADAKRQVERAPLPHNSLCRMGLQTNMRWLHSIRQDRRADRDKTAAELSHGGARISLTFRHIGTFLDAQNMLIWGQGAKGKERANAHPVVNGQTPSAVKMLQAFGRENHASEFDWDVFYGDGFDVLHMGTPKRFCAGTGDAVANARVTIALAELGVACAKGSVEGSAARFEDNDPARAVVEGHDTILRYLDAVYGAGRRYDQLSAAEVARRFSRLQSALDLLGKWRAAQAEAASRDEKGRVGILIGLMKKEMIEWEQAAEEVAMSGTEDAGIGGGPAVFYVAGGTQPSPADFALWPVLHDMVRECGGDEVLQGDYLCAYYRAFGRRSSVEKALGSAAVNQKQ